MSGWAVALLLGVYLTLTSASPPLLKKTAQAAVPHTLKTTAHNQPQVVVPHHVVSSGSKVHPPWVKKQHPDKRKLVPAVNKSHKKVPPVKVVPPRPHVPLHQIPAPHGPTKHPVNNQGRQTTKHKTAKSTHIKDKTHPKKTKKETKNKDLTRKDKTNKTNKTTKTTAVKATAKVLHPAARKAKADELKKYLRAQEDAQAAQRDAERKLAQAYLVFRLYSMLQRFMSKENTNHCNKHSIGLRVGAHSPVFGGVLVDSPRVYISKFSMSGQDDTMSRMELYGCRSLPAGIETSTSNKLAPSPCGAGASTLLWAWYNGQPSVGLPDDTSVLAGYDTDIHFLVARLVKFAPNKKQAISLQERLVKVEFVACENPERYRLSNYRLYRSAIPSKLHVDVSCIAATGFKVWGLVGDMGPNGRTATVWVGNGSSGDEVVGSVFAAHKLEPLSEAISIFRGDSIKLRCEYYKNARGAQPCQVTLLTRIATKDPSPPVVCSTAAKFNDESLLEEYTRSHRYHLMIAIICLVFIAWVIARCSWKGSSNGAHTNRPDLEGEFQGLLYEEDDLQKIK